MPTSITVNNIPIEYPSPGDEPGWGEEATTFAEEVANVLEDLNNSNDILETSFSVGNGQTGQPVTGLAFNTGAVRSAEVSYSVRRVTDSSASGNIEAGTMTAVYDDNGGSGSKWFLAVGNIAGPGAGITFTISDAGQVLYTSTSIAGANYDGEMRFRAKTILST